MDATVVWIVILLFVIGGLILAALVSESRR